jgi:hypothetical protein
MKKLKKVKTRLQIVSIGLTVCGILALWLLDSALSRRGHLLKGEYDRYDGQPDNPLFVAHA